MKNSQGHWPAIYRYAGFFILTIAMTFLLPKSVHAKERCKKHLSKLHQIQVMQRQGNTLKRSQSLRKKEEKARKSWWQCEQSNTKSKAKKKRKDKKKKVKKANQNRYKLKKNVKQKAGITPFKTNRAIVLKNSSESQYSVKKKQAWFTFYQKPKRCLKPKNFNVFAYCTEHRQQQRKVFEQQYVSK